VDILVPAKAAQTEAVGLTAQIVVVAGVIAEVVAAAVTAEVGAEVGAVIKKIINTY